MANKKPVVTALENAGVVVQVVEAPKAEFVLSLETSDMIDQVVDRVLQSEDHAFEADLGMEKSAMMMAQVMGTDPKYIEWEAKRKAWVRKYMSRKPNANEESADRAWSRLAKRMEKEVGLTKPPKGSGDAQRKASKRDEEKKALESMVDSQLEQLLAAYKAEDEFTKANKIKAELKRRSDEANKDKLEYAKELRADIAKRVKVVTDVELLEQIQSMLPELVSEESPI
jgi:type II secretory ATPase GspE/PulE/Tfp pilus assembly ATPase PilB-like protein